jgi:hypothetical protein
MRGWLSVGFALGLVSCCNPAELLEKKGSGASPATGSSSPVSASVAPVPSVVIAAPSTAVPLPFAAGQWARHTIKRPKEAPSTLVFKVISAEGDAHWFEVEAGKPGRVAVIQFLLAAKDRTEASSFELREAKLKLPNGKVQVLRGVQLAATRKMLDQFLAQMRIPKFGTGPREDATVPAGTFEQCHVNQVEGTFFGVKTDSKVWNHPVVPISTMVRSVDSADGAEVLLDAYGSTGAKSVMGS